MNITTEQIQDLFHGRINEVDRGDEYDVIKSADVIALVDNCDIDTDDDGTPLDDQWEVLAEALSNAPTDSPRERALEAVEDAVRQLDNAEAARDAAIRDAIEAGASVISIAAAASLSRARIYQIRDGRR
ncbi:hypothetical protein ACH4TP_38080 [Streptomyces sp. NPDC021012]|uniref:hypothetical protein n=1 Tax=Streptomyces sp. NPDC021012 TaxID=3365107 RepID=UPI0037BCEBCC